MKTQDMLQVIKRMKSLFIEKEDEEVWLRNEFAEGDAAVPEMNLPLLEEMWEVIHEVGGAREFTIEFMNEILYGIEDALDYSEEKEIVDLDEHLEMDRDQICAATIYNPERRDWMRAHLDHQQLVEEVIDDFGWEGVGESLDQAMGWAEQKQKEQIYHRLIHVIEEFSK